MNRGLSTRDWSNSKASLGVFNILSEKVLKEDKSLLDEVAVAERAARLHLDLGCPDEAFDDVSEYNRGRKVRTSFIANVCLSPLDGLLTRWSLDRWVEYYTDALKFCLRQYGEDIDCEIPAYRRHLERMLIAVQESRATVTEHSSFQRVPKTELEYRQVVCVSPIHARVDVELRAIGVNVASGKFTLHSDEIANHLLLSKKVFVEVAGPEGLVVGFRQAPRGRRLSIPIDRLSGLQK